MSRDAERTLPVVIPTPAAEPARHTEPSEALATPVPSPTAATGTSLPPWLKKPAKKPSWVRTRDDEDTPERPEPVPMPEMKAPVEPPKAEPTHAARAEETIAKPAATGLIDRLRREFAEGKDGPTAAPQQKSKTTAKFLDRFRRKGDRPTTAEKRTKAAQKAPKSKPKGQEMSALSPNDLRHYLTQRIAASDAGDTGIPLAPTAGNGKVGPVLRSLDVVLNHVISANTGGLPRALLVAGASPKADATQAAIALARDLVARNEQVVLVDLARGASVVSGRLGMPRVPGFTDLAAGRASFSDVIRIDDETPLQVITAGNPTVPGDGREPDRFMRVFEALTQAYGCVVLHADIATVQALLPALKFELPATVAVLQDGAGLDSAQGTLSTFQALGCPIVVYEAGGRLRRMGLFSRSAAV